MIIIPTFNERENIGPLIGRIRKVLPETPILFVDDNSPDGTADEIKKFQAPDQNIHLIERSAKLGYASAQLAGIKFAINQHAPFIITMDADLSHPPESLPAMIESLQTSDFVIGSRYVDGGRIENWSFFRRLLSRCANWYARILTGTQIFDLTSGFVGLTKDFAMKLNFDQIKTQGYAYTVELKLLAVRARARIMEIPIIFSDRLSGISKLNPRIIWEGMLYPMKIFFRRPAAVLGLIIFVITFGLFLKTLSHTVYTGDSPEFVAAAASLGIPHPSGYPTYVLLAKLFTLLPISTIAFRVGLFSALSAALALICLYVLFLKLGDAVLGERKQITLWVGFGTMLILAFSELFWSQAIMAKVYTPALLCLCIILLLFLKFWETGRVGFIYWSMFLFGIGIGLHEMIGLFLPLIVFVVLIKQQIKPKAIIVSILLLLFGTLVYLLLLVRSHFGGNFYSFPRYFRLGEPGQSFTNFFNYLLRTNYQDLGFGSSWASKIAFFSSFTAGIWQQFSFLTLLAVPGLIILYLRSKKLFVLIVGVILIDSVGIILLRNSLWSFDNEYIYSFYYLPAFAMCSLLIGLGALYLLKLCETLRPKIIFFTLLAIFIFGGPIRQIKRNYTSNNLSHFTAVADYSAEILQSLPQNTVLLIQYDGGVSDTDSFALHYQQVVNHLRPDVTILSVSDIYPQVSFDILSKVFGLADMNSARYYMLRYVLGDPEYQNRPIYTSYLADGLTDRFSWSSRSNGLVYEFFQNPVNSPVKLEDYTINYQKDLPQLAGDRQGRDFLAQYFYAQAVFWADQKDLHQAQKDFILAINYDNQNLDIDQTEFMNHRAIIFQKP